jgi:hypothetical protein
VLIFKREELLRSTPHLYDPSLQGIPYRTRRRKKVIEKAIAVRKLPIPLEVLSA